MTKYSLKDDYSEGMHPQILKAMSLNNMSQQAAYGHDDYCAEARGLLYAEMGLNSSQMAAEKAPNIHFVAGGTLANILCISCALKPFEAVIATHTSHIATREAAAIEATGHRVITCHHKHAKLAPDAIENALNESHSGIHMPTPRMVYISNSTEFGTCYNASELQAISDVCKKNDLYLMIDGARLPAALAASSNRQGTDSLELKQIAEIADIFWIGGTKIGAPFGEAIVITNDKLKQGFEVLMKQRGAIKAKTRFMGSAFAELYRDGLIEQLALDANAMAAKLAEAIIEAGFELMAPADSNMVFAKLPNSVIAQLEKNFDFAIWERIDHESAIIRLVTSWATQADMIEKFILELQKAAAGNS